MDAKHLWIFRFCYKTPMYFQILLQNSYVFLDSVTKFLCIFRICYKTPMYFQILLQNSYVFLDSVTKLLCIFRFCYIVTCMDTVGNIMYLCTATILQKKTSMELVLQRPFLTRGCLLGLCLRRYIRQIYLFENKEKEN